MKLRSKMASTCEKLLPDGGRILFEPGEVYEVDEALAAELLRPPYEFEVVDGPHMRQGKTRRRKK